MGSFPFSNFKRETFFKILRVLYVPRWCRQTVALWRTGLLLSFLHICSSQGKIPLYLIILHIWTRLFSTEEECVLGVVGRPVSLPCFYPPLLNYENFTIEWRRDDKVILRSAFENNQMKSSLSADRSALSLNATVSGDFSLEMPTVDLAEQKMNYGLFIVSDGNQNDALCRVCLRIAGQCTQKWTQTTRCSPLFPFMEYHVLFTLSDRTIAKSESCL